MTVCVLISGHKDLNLLLNPFVWEYAVADLVEALCYEPEGRGIESRCGVFF
jgi:hypothetical protein